MLGVEEFLNERRHVFYPKTDIELEDFHLRRLVAGNSIPESEICHILENYSVKKPLKINTLAEHGTFHQIFYVHYGNHNVIVRVNLLSKERCDWTILSDHWISEKIRSAGLPALEIYHTDISRRWSPYDYQIMEKAHGISLKALEGNEATMQDSLEKFGEYLGKLHTQKIAIKAGWPDIGALAKDEKTDYLEGIFTHFSAHILNRLHEHIESLMASGQLSKEDAIFIVDAIETNKEVYDKSPSCLLHGDPGNHNVFVNDGTVSAVIDWEDALIGDPAYDLGFWASFHPERRYKRFLKGYASVRDISDDFKLRFRLYHLRVTLAKIVLRNRYNFSDIPGRPTGSERISDSLLELKQIM